MSIVGVNPKKMKGSMSIVGVNPKNKKDSLSKVGEIMIFAQIKRNNF